MADDLQSFRDQWITGEPCIYCNLPIDASAGETNWHGVGSPHMPAFAHVECDPEALKERINWYRQALYQAEAVCWAKYRIEVVGDRSVDADADMRQYAEAWTRWKARNEVPPEAET